MRVYSDHIPMVKLVKVTPLFSKDYLKDLPLVEPKVVTLNYDKAPKDVLSVLRFFTRSKS